MPRRATLFSVSLLACDDNNNNVTAACIIVRYEQTTVIGTQYQDIQCRGAEEGQTHRLADQLFLKISSRDPDHLIST